ncbi:hypothetical protein BP5796_08296 [Coleophoma crateriformis]|uniref:Uncharacterized protein n=1 Tax=Coleophoma crateriformis TaxID=565419 RepID=A0A3D8R780_9HELO|nr:hypothetical protein BP5796_08296 [Coleophoma crateriformis]
MKFQLLTLLAAIGLAQASCSVDTYAGTSSETMTCTTSSGAAGQVMNCDSASASAKGCDNGNSLYAAPCNWVD